MQCKVIPYNRENNFWISSQVDCWYLHYIFLYIDNDKWKPLVNGSIIIIISFLLLCDDNHLAIFFDMMDCSGCISGRGWAAHGRWGIVCGATTRRRGSLDEAGNTGQALCIMEGYNERRGGMGEANEVSRRRQGPTGGNIRDGMGGGCSRREWKRRWWRCG